MSVFLQAGVAFVLAHGGSAERKHLCDQLFLKNVFLALLGFRYNQATRAKWFLLLSVAETLVKAF